ncbi:fatty acid-binding protein, heart-like [Amphiura filiformis]|uniref:fatty acid-binding protein, heart-like n=1 Tax=Amphiura filiformis TaxID=82378 RepID=UPI003B2118EA
MASTEANAEAAPQANANFSGTWRLEKNDENFDKFWCEMGVNYFVRKMMGMSRPTTIIKQEGNKFDITNQSMKGSDTQTFTAGEEYDFSNPWTKEINRMSPAWEGDKLVIKPVEKPDEQPTVSRHLEGEYLVLTMKKGDVATNRYYKKVET